MKAYNSTSPQIIL